MLNTKAQRLYFIDNLKILMVILLIASTTAVCYMNFAPGWWYIIDPTSSYGLTVVSIWIDVLIFPTLFFLSGYLGIKALAERGPRSFCISKLIRLVIPWIAGTLLLAPPVTYTIFLSRNLPVSFQEFYTKFFLGPLYSQNQFWFLGTVFAFYAVMLAVVKLRPALLERRELKLQSDTGKALDPTRKPVMAAIIFTFTVTVITSYIFKGNDIWLPISYVWIIQPTRIAIYITYFILGIYMWRNRWFEACGNGNTEDKSMLRIPLEKWLPAFIIMSILYTGYCLFGSGANLSELAAARYLVFKSLLYTMLSLASVFCFISLFQSQLNFTNKVLGNLSAVAYPMYFCYMAVSLLIVWLMVPIALPALAKFAISTIGAFILGFLISRIVLIHIPCFAAGKKAINK